MHARISVNTLCFPGSAFRELATYWRELDASRVSMVSIPLFDEGLSAAQDALGTGDYRVETITHPFLYNQHLQPNEESWTEARLKLIQLIDTAKVLGAQSIYVSAGGHGSLTWEEAAAYFSEAIAPCVAHAKAVGIPLMVENAPQLYPDTNIVHTLRDAVMLAEMADIGVCIDIFSCWTEAGLRDSIQRAMPRCHIVQISDYVYGDRSLPARAVPGDGAIPIRRIADWILSAGYAGAFDLELIGPRIDKEGRLAAVQRAAAYLGETLISLGV
jgi:sugar phosphate isomerase/epimerase